MSARQDEVAETTLSRRVMGIGAHINLPAL